MTDIKTGKLFDDCLEYRLLSIIVEGRCDEDTFKDVIHALTKVEKEIDTVFSLVLISRVDENGECKALEYLEEIGLSRPYRANSLNCR